MVLMRCEPGGSGLSAQNPGSATEVATRYSYADDGGYAGVRLERERAVGKPSEEALPGRVLRRGLELGELGGTPES